MSTETFVKLGGTQNKAWVESSGKSFGMKMMKMMGWKEGEGLGKEGDGQVTHIQIKRRQENQGLGVSDNDRNKTFIATIDNFNDVLSSLNKQHSSELDKMKKKEKKLKKKAEKKEKRRKEKEERKKKELEEEKEENGNKSEDTKEKKMKKKKKTKVAHKYHKFLKNKTVSNYSTEDLNAILGISPIEEESSSQ